MSGLVESTHRVVRGMAAFAVLFALVVVLPVVLARAVGSPLPSAVPSLRAVVDEVERRGVGDDALVKVLAVVLWVAWARFSLSVVVEIVAAVRRRPARSHGVLGSSQRIASGLVAAVVALTSLAAGMGGAGATPVDDRFVSMTDDVVALRSPMTSPLAVSFPAVGRTVDITPAVSVSSSSTPPEPAEQVWVVARNDSLWGIAEATLGDGTRWREIADANAGRAVAPGIVFDSASDVIRPGWALLVPTGRVDVGRGIGPGTGASLGDVDAGSVDSEVLSRPDRTGASGVASGDVSSPVVSVSATHPEVAPGAVAAVTVASMTPASRAEHVQSEALRLATDVATPGVATTFASATTAPAALGTTPTGTSCAVPVVDSGVELAGPTPDGSAASAAAIEPVGGAPVPASVVDAPATAVGQHDAQDRSTAPTVLGLGVATLLGTGVIRYVMSLRRRRLQGAGPDVRLPRASSGSPQFEMALRSVSADERMARVDVAVRAAVAHLTATEQTARVVVVVAVDDGAVEIHLDRPALMVPGGFVASGPSVWVLTAGADPTSISVGPRFAAFPCPALAQLGRRNGGDVLVDLESCGLLAVHSEETSARDLLRSMVASVTFSPFGENVGLVVVGDETMPSGDHGTVEHVADLDAAIDRAADLIAPILAVLGPGDSTAALRMRSAGEGWDPVVVAAFGTVPRSLGAELPALADPPGRGLAVVVGRGVPDAPWRVVESAGAWRLDPFGITFEPCGLSVDDSRHLADMIADAREPLVVLETTGRHGSPEVMSAAESSAREPHPEYSDPDWSVMVRLLGPLDVVDRRGTVATFERPKAAELVAWLTEHREGATRGRARAALWAQDVQDSTFANVVSDARRGLAGLVAPPIGEEWIGRTLTEHLPLHRSVITDAALLTARRRWATGRSAVEAIQVLRPGLELVRDAPFSGSAALWPDAEGVVSNLTLLVVASATDLAERYLERGDHDGVFWATAKGLLALPGHEGLIALRMRAHADADDLAGVRTEWESYERVLAADPWGDASPAAKLVELRRRLLASDRVT